MHRFWALCSITSYSAFIPASYNATAQAISASPDSPPNPLAVFTLLRQEIACIRILFRVTTPDASLRNELCDRVLPLLPLISCLTTIWRETARFLRRRILLGSLRSSLRLWL